MLGTDFTTKQKEVLLNARSRWNFLVGAVRSGKTFVMNALAVLRLAEIPGTPRAIIGKTESTILRNVIHPMQEQMPEGKVSDIYSRERKVDIFGTPFYVIGANNAQAVKKIKGISLQYAYGDEITTWPKGFFEMLKSRLDKSGAKFDGSTNPEGPNHWFKQNILDRQDELDIYHKHFVLEDNTFLDPEFVKQLKQEYSGVWFTRYIEGKWIKAEGIVYDMFDPDIHVVNELPVFKHFWVGVDYGTANPTHFNLIGTGQDNNLYLIDEWRHAGRETGRSMTDSDYSRKLQEWLDMHRQRFGNFYPKWIFVDPSAKSFIEQLKRDGVKRLAPADNTVLDGIRQVQSLLGTDNFMIHESCQETIDELSSYVWDEKAQERGEDKPKKGNDHSMDSLRYVIHSFGRKYYRAVMQGQRTKKQVRREDTF